jgi:hypothetical protein
VTKTTTGLDKFAGPHFLVVGPCYWGRGRTVDLARKHARQHAPSFARPCRAKHETVYEIDGNHVEWEINDVTSEIRWTPAAGMRRVGA